MNTKTHRRLTATRTTDLPGPEVNFKETNNALRAFLNNPKHQSATFSVWRKRK